MLDLLQGRTWHLVGRDPASDAVVAELDGDQGPSGAMLAEARGLAAALAVDHDALQWTFSATAEVDQPGVYLLELPGVATHWSASVDGETVATGRSMFRGTSVTVELSLGPHVIKIACEPLALAATPSRPRAAWRSKLMPNQAYRWHRTTGLGRIAWPGVSAAVGPWRPVRLVRAAPARIRTVECLLHERGTVGRVVVHLDWGAGARDCVEVRLSAPSCGDRAGQPDDVVKEVAAGMGRVEFDVPKPAVWWPHTHGQPAIHHLSLRLPGTDPLEELEGRNLGFRTLRADTTDDGFALVVNGVRIFARGAVWIPVDPQRLVDTPDRARVALQQFVDAGFNLVRVPGTSGWLDATFHDLCDELGLMVWQDAAVHTLALPDDPAFLADYEAELRENLVRLAGHPSSVVLSGGTESEQQPTMWGLPPERRHSVALHEVTPRVAAEVLPDVVHVVSSPTGGPLPTSISHGISHWFGVSAYRRPLTAARTDRVRFAAECLAFAVPPERWGVRRSFAADAAGQAAMRAAVVRDPGADWDFEQVLAHYTRELLDIDVERVRAADPELALDLLRATGAHLFESVLGELRTEANTCDGAVVLSARDLDAGAGWGLVDASGRPKASWFGARRSCRPITVLVTDEGLSGLALHVVNDPMEQLDAVVRVEVTSLQTQAVAFAVQTQVQVAPHGQHTIWLDSLIGSFTDINHAWAFGEPAYDTVRVVLESAGDRLCDVTHLLGGLARPRLHDGQLVAAVEALDAGVFGVRVAAGATATFVAIEPAPDQAWTPTDNWFHMPAGTERLVEVQGCRNASPQGSVRALNAGEVAFGG